ncbi:MAG: hormogonium polysaccharide secretion pseudopilin HpsB [Calothrix sp. MO_167.B42]|nr:hormogonium polysaccharide secretion pseudopilin HpsB [Calothrix sp. MO_167.B42]
MNFKPYKILSKSGESGFTIIESLIAMVVVSVLMVAVAPVVVFSAATRVQSKRVELATQAAKTYIEGVRAGAIGAPATGSGVPTVGSLTCNANAYCTVPATPADNLYCIDGDGGGCTLDSNKDFIVQAFRSNPDATAGAAAGYFLEVRVYRADGFQNDGALTQASKQSTISGGLGGRKAPLVKINTEITSESNSFNDLCNRLKDVSNASSNSSCT